MKKTGLLLFILSVWMTSCWVQNKWYNTINVQNESGHDVEIITYQTELDDQGDRKLISILTSLKKDSIYVAFVKDGEDYHTQDVSKLYNAATDSCYVIFDGTRKSVFFPCKLIANCDTMTKNIFLIDYSYEINCPRKVGCDYTYIITEEDYENAVSLE